MVESNDKATTILKDIILPVVTVLLTVLSIFFGTDIVGRFFGKVIIYNLSQGELSLPPGFKVVPAHADDLLPDRLVSFSFSNETSTNCIKPLFRIRVPGTVIKVDISDSSEKKEVIQSSVVYETRSANNDTARFESERLAPRSFINGHLWFKDGGSGQSLSPDLSSEDGFTLRKLGQENKTLTGPISTFISALLGGFSAFLITTLFSRR